MFNERFKFIKVELNPKMDCMLCGKKLNKHIGNRINYCCEKCGSIYKERQYQEYKETIRRKPCNNCGHSVFEKIWW